VSAEPAEPQPAGANEEPTALGEFLSWLGTLVERRLGSRDALGLKLGPGGRERVGQDLSGAYLPAWEYVVTTYLGPIQELTGKPLPIAEVRVGKRLHEAASDVALAWSPSEPPHESYSRIIAPVLAGFSLPAIVSLATSSTPGQPYRDIALACFISATGCFLASLQLTIGRVYIYTYGGKLRSGLTFAGIMLLVAALMVLVASVSEHWWTYLALGVLGVGGSTSALAIAWVTRGRPAAIYRELFDRL
jgi:hypothetical protein